MDTEQAFYEGEKYFRKNDLINARNFYNISVNDTRYKDESLAKLLEIEIKEGNYAKAREYLENYDINNANFKIFCGTFECSEYNFKQSEKYYLEAMNIPGYEYMSLFYLTRLHSEIGEYKVAEKMLQTMQMNYTQSFNATYELVCLYLAQRKYYEAKECFKMIDKSKVSERKMKNYIELDYYVRYFLGELKMQDVNYHNLYNIDRLFHHTDENLLKHIDRHKDQSRKEYLGCFLDDLDSRELLAKARGIMENINSTRFKFFDIYRFRLDEPIGYKCGEFTNALAVVSITGINDIITMYPITLSKDFNSEGMLTSDELRLKRIMGR